MNKAVKIIGIALGVIVLVLAGAVGYFNLSYPDVDPAPNITVERTPERIARGEYLANYVTVCIDCHSTRDWSKFAGPVMPGTEGKGGEEFNEQIGGVPGSVFSSNITPAGIAGYSDGELLRTFTTGVTRENRALFPIMPYPSYHQLSEEDAYSIVAYIRSLPPIENTVGESKLNFPLNFIVKTIPLKSYTPKPAPDRNNEVEYGRYMATIAACGDCHTPAEKGEPIPGMDFAGGFSFMFPGGVVKSLNITPDEETGIGLWTKEDFVARFKAFADSSSQNIPVEMHEFNTPMSWIMYAGMTDDDLGAIYTYLRTLKPVKNQVEKFTPHQQAAGK
ncbi:cytochrome C [Sphingobacteriales bacterium CHB3]|nr:cytochrome C [Sphingobacteriales bacterium CHB3]